jgi:hypothetical protein
MARYTQEQRRTLYAEAGPIRLEKARRQDTQSFVEPSAPVLAGGAESERRFRIGQGHQNRPNRRCQRVIDQGPSVETEEMRSGDLEIEERAFGLYAIKAI